MMKFNNEKGITLVEVLVVLLISSIVGAILYSIVILTMNYNTVETTKTSLQQEANYIVTEIQRIHRQCDSYTLIIDSEYVEIKDCIDSAGELIENTNKIISDKFQYVPMAEKMVDPKISNLKITCFKISAPENRNLSVNIKTEFSRYLEVNKTEEIGECNNE